MRFDAAFRVACQCCKADGANVPEVEAVIRLLLPALLGAWRTMLVDLRYEAERLLDARRPADDLELLLAAYVTRLETVAATPFARGVRLRVEQAAGSLIEAAPAANALLEIEARLARELLAAEQLQLLFQDLAARAVARSAEAARVFLDARSGLGSEEAQEAARTALRAALDAEAAVLPLLDSWSYQTWNQATVRAAAADGHNFIQLVAKIDDATTTFCRLVNGRIVPMARALAQLDRIEAAVRSGDVAALVSAAPFIANPRTATQADVDAALERGGLAPFHHGCRTQNVPIRLTAQPS